MGSRLSCVFALLHHRPGLLHIGGARTALYNWLQARGQADRAGRQARHAFVLRIEDTDRERSTPENVEQILDALRWLELDWDEGPVFQAQRADRHAEVLAQLLRDGHAYHSNVYGRRRQGLQGAPWRRERLSRRDRTGGCGPAARARHGRDHGRRRDPRPDAAFPTPTWTIP